MAWPKQVEGEGQFARDHQTILERNNWDHLAQEVLISTPRRFGKTISVSMFAAAMIFSAARVELSIYSTCKRISQKLLRNVRKFIDMIFLDLKIQPYKVRLCHPCSLLLPLTLPLLPTNELHGIHWIRLSGRIKKKYSCRGLRGLKISASSTATRAGFPRRRGREVRLSTPPSVLVAMICAACNWQLAWSRVWLCILRLLVASETDIFRNQAT